MTAMTAKRNPSMPTAMGTPSTSDGSAPVTTSKGRTFSGLNLNTNGATNKFAGNPNTNPNNTTGQKIKNFFRINSLNKNDLPPSNSDNPSIDSIAGSNASSQQDVSRSINGSSTQQKSSLRNSRFIPHLGRTRSTTVASDGNPLDTDDEMHMSPTASANPYFQHQGPPALRHRNEGSVPPSPPDTPRSGTAGVDKNGNLVDKKEAGDLARRLRRVASAPNAQGLFGKLTGGRVGSGSAEGRPGTADTDGGAVPTANSSNTSAKAFGNGLYANNSSTLSISSTPTMTLPIAPNNPPPAGGANMGGMNGDLLPVPGIMSPGKLRNSIAFRRTYSSNSIKVRDVEVGPGSFDKIKLIGKGDVGKVYLVREKKSSRLYAMKGMIAVSCS